MLTSPSLHHAVPYHHSLPFTEAVVARVSADKRTVHLKTTEPTKAEFDLNKYPWLTTSIEMRGTVHMLCN
jgi:hypothetical protein